MFSRPITFVKALVSKRQKDSSDSQPTEITSLEQLQEYEAQAQKRSGRQSAGPVIFTPGCQPGYRMETVPIDLLIKLAEQLQGVSLACQSIRSLPAEVAQLKRLRQINLSRNKLTGVPEALGSLGALEDLDLSHNQLQSLPEALGGLTNLRCWPILMS